MSNYELKDFDLLKVLKTQDKSIKIVKVRCKKDNKIYCLRKIKKEGSYNENDIQKLNNILININHPHIIKYYGYFEENGNLYFLMEYIDIDIKDYIESKKLMNEEVPEETIFFLLMQCLSALKYIYSIKDAKGLGIKFSNIFMPTERGIKIALIKDDLKVSNESKDISLLYKYFELIMFPQRFKPDQSIQAYLSDKQNNSYGKELREIIYNMKDSNPRNAGEILKITENYYIDEKYELKRCEKNSGIKSAFKCLAKCDKLKKYYLKEGKTTKDTKDKKDNDYLLINILKSIFDESSDEYFPAIEKLRRLIALEYPAFDNIKEINPIFVINLILKCNENFEFVENNLKKNITISDLFSVQNVARTCKNCQHEITSNNTIIFDMCKINKEIFNLSLNGFKNDKNTKCIELFCDKCSTYQKFDELFNYNNFSDYLIVCFDRGNDYKNETKIIFPVKDLKIDISSNGSQIFVFDLIGYIIKKPEGENYIFENKEEVDKIPANEQDKIMVLIYQKIKKIKK